VYNNHSASYDGGIYNLAGGLWDIQTNATVYNEELGDEFFNNAGTLSKSGGLGIAYIFVPLTNTGTINALTGTLSFNGSFTTVGGTLGFGVRGLSTFGQIDITGNVALNGTASVSFLDGFIPSIGNSFALFDYGSHSGTFASIALPSGTTGTVSYTSTVFSLMITGISSPTNSPLLNTERVTPTTVVVSWPTSAAGFGLQTSSNLLKGSWIDISSGIFTVGTNHVLTNTIGGKAAFFRLQSD
jgi:hypothetical protein